MDELKDAVRELSEKTSRLGALEGALDRNGDELKHIGDRLSRLEAARNRPGAPGGGRFERAEGDEHKSAFADWLRRPDDDERRARLRQLESKTASGASGAAGGFMVPEPVIGPLMQRAKDGNPVRALAQVLSVQVGDPKLILTGNDATSGWVGETGTRTGTTEPTLKQIKPSGGTLYCYVAASEELIGDAAFDVSSWFTNAVGDELARAEMVAFISGSGSDQPEGMLNVPPEAGANGTRTAGAFRYVATGEAADFLAPDAATGVSGGDALVDMVYTLLADYRQGASWLMNSTTAAAVRNLKDASGRFIWSDSLAPGQPTTLLGYPVAIAEGMPDVGAGTFPILFGDFRRAYAIVDRGPMRVTVDDNVTAPGLVKWYVRKRTYGAVTDENAAVALKVAAS